MGREHTPRPGATWAQEPVTVELVVDEDGKPVGLSREQRRALERAKRRKGGKR
jgi:hypothetical protein